MPRNPHIVRWRISTPRGWFVPGLTGRTPTDVWRKYCKVMGESVEQLKAKGYLAVQFKPNAR